MPRAADRHRHDKDNSDTSNKTTGSHYGPHNLLGTFIPLNGTILGPSAIETGWLFSCSPEALSRLLLGTVIGLLQSYKAILQAKPLAEHQGAIYFSSY